MSKKMTASEFEKLNETIGLMADVCETGMSVSRRIHQEDGYTGPCLTALSSVREMANSALLLLGEASEACVRSAADPYWMAGPGRSRINWIESEMAEFRIHAATKRIV